MEELEILLTRGVDKIYPTKEELEKILRTGKKLKIYQGFDPTGAQLHIGHMIGLRKLAQWQKMGHKVIFLIGDFTARIGDPSGKSELRKPLNADVIEENAKKYKEQAGRILDFNGSNPIEVRFNSEWLKKLSWIELLDIARHLSVQQVIERDLFQERLKKGKDVFMNEFFYPVLQAYDSVAMEIDLEVGGSDQMFNMLMGRKLMRNMNKKEKFVMTTPLLTDSSGQKIGKTEGNVIALNDKPSELYRKIMSLGDDIIIIGLEYLTDIPSSQINEIKEKIKNSENPITYKKVLAFEVTKQLNSENEAQNAAEEFERVVQHKEVPSNLTEIEVNEDIIIDDDFLVQNGLAISKSEAKRLFNQNGVALNEIKIKNGEEIAGEKNENYVLRIGKRMIKLNII